jgi:hypothetical protein
MLTDPQSYLDRELGPVDQARCDKCPPERVCAWDCEQGQGLLEIMMGEALAEQARRPIELEPDAEPIDRVLYEIYT